MYIKRIIFLITLLISTNCLLAQEKINWISFEEAQKKSKIKSKKIFVDVYTTWCGPCKMLNNTTFANKDVIKYINENYYAVKFNAESPKEIMFLGKKYNNKNYVANKPGRNSVHDLSRLLRVSSYPTLIFMDKDFQIIQSIPGYKDYASIEYLLKIFNHKDIKPGLSKEEGERIVADFQKTYKPSFKPNQK
tara:strand:- start:527 stop:1099 length:573 start_codon:yes stop_codon:yes gene_type:complete